MKRLALLVLLGGCASVPKQPRNLEEWFALARKGAALAERGVELQKRKDACEAFEREPVPLEEEKALGGAAAIRFVKQSGGLIIQRPPGLRQEDMERLEAASVPDDEAARLTRYVNVVGRNLAFQSSRPTLPWMFGVLQSSQPQVFSAPGGIVLVSRGLLSKLENEAQLAGVLAHEIAHVNARHALLQYQRRKASACTRSFLLALSDEVGVSEAVRGRAESTAKSFESLLASGAGGALDLNDTQKNLGALITLAEEVVEDVSGVGFTREEELDADREAARLLSDAGYDPRAYAKALTQMPSAWARHPDVESRVQSVESVARSQTEASLKTPALQKP